MKNYRLIIREADREIFDQLIAGSKSIETRAVTPKYRRIKVEDTLTFVCGPDSLTKQVTRVSQFASIDDLYSHLPLAKVLPSIRDIKEAKQIHYSFPGYKEKLDTHGIVAFELR